MDNFVPILLTSAITFFAFFFSVPYWTGSEMQDVSKNGVYRLVYCKCSGVGHAIYRALEHVTVRIDGLVKAKPGSTVHTIVNLMLYIVAVYLLNALYDISMTSLVEGEFGEIQLDLSSSYSRLQEVMLAWSLMNNFQEVTGIGSFFAALKQSLFGITAFVVGTFFFFSVMYGLLEQKVIEMRVAERLHWRSKLEDENKDGVADLSLRNLFTSVIGNVQDFLNKIAVLRNFQVLGVVFAFLGLLLVYSAVRALRGEVADTQSLLMDLLDESDVLNSVGSFVIGFVYAKIVVVFGRVVYRVCPPSVRTVIDRTSNTCNAAVETIKAKRDDWSSKMDSLYQRTGGSWRRNGDKYALKRMKLE